MPRGGTREGAGRKRGSPNRRTQATIAKAEGSGILPLEYMLMVMRDPNAPDDRRAEMAKAAAPYIHARLSSVDHVVEPLDLTKLTDEEFKELARLRRLAEPEDKGGRH